MVKVHNPLFLYLAAFLSVLLVHLATPINADLDVENSSLQIKTSDLSNKDFVGVHKEDEDLILIDESKPQLNQFMICNHERYHSIMHYTEEKEHQFIESRYMINPKHWFDSCLPFLYRIM